MATEPANVTLPSGFRCALVAPDAETVRSLGDSAKDFFLALSDGAAVNTEVFGEFGAKLVRAVCEPCPTRVSEADYLFILTWIAQWMEGVARKQILVM